MRNRLACIEVLTLMAVIAVSVLSSQLVIAEKSVSLHAFQQNLLKLSGLRALVDLELVLIINVGGSSPVERHVTIPVGQLLDAEAPFNVDVSLPLDWSITGVASNGTVLLDLAGKLTSDGSRWLKAYLDETRLKVEFERPVISFILRASRIQLVLEGTTTVREFHVQMNLDLNGDGAYKEDQTANVTSTDGVFTCRSRVLVTTRRQIPFLVNVFNENGTLAILEGLIHLEEGRGSISGTLNSTKWEFFPSLKAELNYYVGTISVELPNDIFKAKEGKSLSEQVETASILFVHGFQVVKPLKLVVKVLVGVEGRPPLPEANVTVKLEGRVIAKATTDPNGTAVFELPPAKYNLTAEKIGYEINSTSVDLKAEETELTIVLGHIPSWLDVAVGTMKKNIVWIALIAIVALVLYVIYKRGGG